MQSVSVYHAWKFHPENRALIESSHAKINRLTKREREILYFIVAGTANKIIAHKLCVSQRTIENHRLKITRKTGCHTHSSLISLFILTVRDCLPYCAITKRCNDPFADCMIKNKLLHK